MEKHRIRYTWIFIFICLITGYFFVFFPSDYSRVYLYILGGIIVVSYGLLANMWLPEYEGWKTVGFFKQVVACINIVILIGLLYFLNGSYLKHQLKQNVIITYARVIGFKTTHIRSSLNYSALIMYQYNKSSYLQAIDNNNHSYKLQDSFRLLCSAEDPEIFKIIGYKPAQASTQ
jgi:hypothetical protein